MIEARYPNGLPYYQHWVTLDAVAHHHGLSVGNFAHLVDISGPYFLQRQAWDADAGRALATRITTGALSTAVADRRSPQTSRSRERFLFAELRCRGRGVAVP